MLGGRYEPEQPPGDAPALLAARDHLFAARVLLLVLRPPQSLLGRLEALRRLRQLAHLQHPDLARISGVGEHEGLLYAAVQPLPGETVSVLHDLLLDRPPRVRQVQHVGAAVLGALSAVHEAGLVHGDVGPGAVLLGGSGAEDLAVALLPASARSETSDAPPPGSTAGPPSVADDLRQAVELVRAALRAAPRDPADAALAAEIDRVLERSVVAAGERGVDAGTVRRDLLAAGAGTDRSSGTGAGPTGAATLVAPAPERAAPEPAAPEPAAAESAVAARGAAPEPAAAEPLAVEPAAAAAEPAPASSPPARSAAPGAASAASASPTPSRPSGPTRPGSSPGPSRPPRPAASRGPGGPAASPAPARSGSPTRSRRRAVLVLAGVVAAVVLGYGLVASRSADPSSGEQVTQAITAPSPSPSQPAPSSSSPTAAAPAAPGTEPPPGAQEQAPAPAPAPPAPAAAPLPSALPGLVDRLQADPQSAGPAGPELLAALRGLQSGDADARQDAAMRLLPLLGEGRGLQVGYATAARTTLARALLGDPRRSGGDVCLRVVDGRPAAEQRSYSRQLLQRLPDWVAGGFPPADAGELQAVVARVAEGDARFVTQGCRTG